MNKKKTNKKWENIIATTVGGCDSKLNQMHINKVFNLIFSVIDRK